MIKYSVPLTRNIWSTRDKDYRVTWLTSSKLSPINAIGLTNQTLGTTVTNIICLKSSKQRRYKRLWRCCISIFFFAFFKKQWSVSYVDSRHNQEAITNKTWSTRNEDYRVTRLTSSELSPINAINLTNQTLDTTPKNVICPESSKRRRHKCLWYSFLNIFFFEKQRSVSSTRNLRFLRGSSAQLRSN